MEKAGHAAPVPWVPAASRATQPRSKSVCTWPRPLCIIWSGGLGVSKVDIDIAAEELPFLHVYRLYAAVCEPSLLAMLLASCERHALHTMLCPALAVQIARLFDLFLASHPLMPLYVAAAAMRVRPAALRCAVCVCCATCCGNPVANG